MVTDYFVNGKIYFDLRNYKYETVFHMAGKKNSASSIKALVQKACFQEELLKRDFKGDTPLHSAAKAGSIDVLSFFLTACTPRFMELENDFGMTPLVAVQEKISMIRDKVSDKEIGSQEKDKLYRKMEKLLAVQVFIQEFGDFITQ